MSQQHRPGEQPEEQSTILPADAERRLRQDAETVADAARTEAGNVKAEVEAQASALVDEAKTQVGNIAEHAKGIVAEQKDVAASQIHGFASAVDKVARELESENATMAGYARTVADAANRFSATMKHKDVDDLISMAEDFARRQPAAFVGMAALAGFAASRFLRASATHRPPASAPSTSTGYRGDGGQQPDRHAGADRTYDQMGGSI